VTIVVGPDIAPGADLDELLRRAFASVHASVVGSTAAFLDGDRTGARLVSAGDAEIDDLFRRIQEGALAEFVGEERPSTGRLRELVVVLRIAPELERSGDLAVHIAELGAQRLASWLSPRALDLIGQMGALGAAMWLQAGEAYQARDQTAGPRLRALDDEVDDLHLSLLTEVASAHVSVPVAIQIGIVARYFERLGDHAVNVTQQLALP
jgi:phosphate transport system protein